MNTKEFELENELRRQAAAIPAQLPRGLTRTVGAAIAEATPGAAPSWHWAWSAGVGGAVAAVVVGLVAIRQPTVRVDTHADAAALAAEIQGMPQRVIAALQTPAAAAPSADPLHEEAVALASSARSALGFLSYNFLPVTNS